MKKVILGLVLSIVSALSSADEPNFGMYHCLAYNLIGDGQSVTLTERQALSDPGYNLIIDYQKTFASVLALGVSRRADKIQYVKTYNFDDGAFDMYRYYSPNVLEKDMYYFMKQDGTKLVVNVDAAKLKAILVYECKVNNK